MVRIYNRNQPTQQELEAEKKKIEEQRKLFLLDVELQRIAVEFREEYLKWLEGTVTLAFPDKVKGWCQALRKVADLE